MGRLSKLGGALVIALLGPPVVASAQFEITAEEKRQQSVPTLPPLERRITLQLRQVALETALQEITRQSGVKLIYSRTFVPLARRVSVEGVRISVADALRLALRETGVVASMGSNGAVILEAAQHEEGDSGHRNGAIVGRITDAKTGEPLVTAEVLLDGTRWKTKTDTAGRYRLADVDSGSYTMTLRRLGYKKRSQQVTVRGVGEDTIDVALESAPVALSELITTATGPQRRRDVANGITTINVDSVMQTAPILSLTSLLENRVPGMTLQHTSGAPGDPAKIRLRGLGSSLLNNDPVVIVDGMRIYNTQAAARSGNLTNLAAGFTEGVGSGATVTRANPVNVPAPSPLDQIDVNTIETIEVIKGPSAATLYGADAGAGVIVVTTKRGRPGPTQWIANFQRSYTSQPGKYPTGYYRWGHDMYLDVPRFCTIIDLTCVPDSLVKFQALNQEGLTLLGQGVRSALSLSASGGSQALTYAVTTSYSEETGTLKLPTFEIDNFQSRFNYTPPDWMQRPLRYEIWSVTSTLTAKLSSTAHVSLHNELTRSEQQRSTLEQQLAPFSATYIDTLNGRYYRPRTGYILASDSVLLSGYYAKQTASTFTLNTTLQAGWQPRSWFTANALAGLSMVPRTDEALLPSGLRTSSIGDPTRNGIVTHGTGRSLIGTFNLQGNFRKSIGRGFIFSTDVGANIVTRATKDLVATATGLVPGTNSIRGASNLAATEMGEESSVFGWYLAPRITGQRLSFETGLRIDGGSNYGTRITGSNSGQGIGGTGIKNPFSPRNLFGLRTLFKLPKFGASWVVSEEPWFPLPSLFSSLRLRGAYGQAQNQPRVTDRLRLYQFQGPLAAPSNPPVVYPITTTLQFLGNDQLRPERVTEFEGGLDADILDGRVSVELTAYRKSTQDLLQQQFIPASVNGGSSLWVNIGNVRNTGLELSLGLTPVRLPLVIWHTRLMYSQNKNVLTKLGEGVTPSPADGRVLGYPLNSRWARPIIAFADQNSDGVLQPGEIVVGDSLVYMGRLQPAYSASLHTSMQWFRSTLGISASFSYLAGATQVNTLAQQFIFSQALVDPSVPMSEQAAVLASTRATNRTDYGLINTVATLRFTTLSINYRLPTRVAQFFRMQKLAVALQGENLGYRSTYNGKDPDVNAWAPGESIVDTGQLPKPRLWQLRVDLDL